MGFGGYSAFQWLFGGEVRYTGPVDTVRVQKVQLRITEGGELESSANSDIKCKVKVKKGVTIKISSVIDDGTEVRGGNLPEVSAAMIGMFLSRPSPLAVSPAYDVATVALEQEYYPQIADPGTLLVELDATPLEEELKDQQVIRDKAYAEYMSAVYETKIVEKQNAIDMQKALGDYEIACVELEKYKKGDFEVESADLDKKIKDALSNVLLWQKRYPWLLSMQQRGYYTPTQVEAEIAKKNSDELLLKNLLKQREILDDYTRKKMITELEVKKKIAKLAIEITEEQNRAKLEQARANEETKRSLYEQEEERYREILERIRMCKIYAPRDGLVIYHVPEQSRWGRGSSQSIIAPNEPVDYDQKLMQIPDLTKMQVKARIHEAMIKYLRSVDHRYPETWKPAIIRVSAYPSKLYKGYVKKVATVASKQDWLSTDVRVYETIIVLADCEDLQQRRLKPGMSATVTIIAYETPKPVLTIPVQAVVGSIGMGKKQKCFVIDEDGHPELRDIVVGMSNEQVVEVVSGLKEGERVALDPESLLPKDSDLRAVSSGTSPRYPGGFPRGGRPGMGRGKGTGKGPRGKADPSRGGAKEDSGKAGAGGGRTRPPAARPKQ